MRIVVIFGVVLRFLVVLYLISGLLQLQGTELSIIFSSAMDTPLGDPDFEVNPQKYFELYTMNLDGSDIQRVTENLFWENQPDVSPDGQSIRFSIHESDGCLRETDPGWEIAVMDIDGGNLVLLTDNEYLDFVAHWNHDGTRIVYVSDSAHRTVDDDIMDVLPRFDIYVMNADGSGKEQLTFAEPGDVNADSSLSHTESERILYIHSEGLSGSFDMYLMDADGENQHLVLPHDDELLAINDPCSPLMTQRSSLRLRSEKNPTELRYITFSQ